MLKCIYLIIFLTHGWLDSIHTFRIIIFKYIIKKYSDKNNIICLQKNRYVIIKNIMKFLDVDVDIRQE